MNGNKAVNEFEYTEIANYTSENQNSNNDLTLLKSLQQYSRRVRPSQVSKQVQEPTQSTVNESTLNLSFSIEKRSMKVYPTSHIKLHVLT